MVDDFPKPSCSSCAPVDTDFKTAVSNVALLVLQQGACSIMRCCSGLGSAGSIPAAERLENKLQTARSYIYRVHVCVWVYIALSRVRVCVRFSYRLQAAHQCRAWFTACSSAVQPQQCCLHFGCRRYCCLVLAASYSWNLKHKRCKALSTII